MALNGQLLSGNNVAAEIINNTVRPVEQERMPLCLARGGSFLDWLASRAVDNRRPNARILKKMLGLKSIDAVSTALHVHAATVTDNFWFRQHGERLTWDEVRFVENPYADLALTGNFLAYSDEMLRCASGTQAPDLTTIGAFEKAWKHEDGVWYLYKQGNANERFSELATCKLGKLRGFDMVEYEPTSPYIKSRDFTASKWNYEPAASIVEDDMSVTEIYDTIRALNPALTVQYLNIIYLDALVSNPDRHSYNYGFLRNTDSGEIVSMAPNFDNNLSLISHDTEGSPLGSIPLLIQRFVKLLKHAKEVYPLPRQLTENEIREIAASTLPDEPVNRALAAELLINRQRILLDSIANL